MLDVRSRTGLLVLRCGRAPRAGDAPDDAALAAAAGAERLLALDAGFPGVFRLRLTRHAPDERPLLRGRLRCGAQGARLGDDALLSGDDEGLPAPLPRGRHRVGVHTPASQDPEAPDFVLVAAPLAAHARAGGRPLAGGPALVDPARHPRPAALEPRTRLELRVRLETALRAARDDPTARRAALDASLRANPRDARALVLRAEVTRELGDLARALDDAWRATTVAPNDGGAWSALASLLRAAGRRGEAARAAAWARELGRVGGPARSGRRPRGPRAAR